MKLGHIIVSISLLASCAQESGMSGGAAADKKNNKAPTKSTGDAAPTSAGTATGTPVATSSPSPGPSSAGVAADPTIPVPLPLQFTRLPDGARNTNCLYITLNGGAEQQLGCNKGTDAAIKTTSVMALPKPSCNSVRLRMTSNGVTVWSTQNAADIAKYFKPPQVSPGKIQLQCNDNGDSDFNDMNLIMDSLGQISFTIENTGIACN